MKLLTCLNCNVGVLLPLSDSNYSTGGEIHFSTWICSNPRCLWNLQIKQGRVSMNVTVNRAG